MKLSLSGRASACAAALVAAAVALVPLAGPSGAAASACSSIQSGPSRVGTLGGIARPLAVGGRCAAHAYGEPFNPGGAPPLIWHKGPVMGTKSTGDMVVVTPIYWAGAGYSFTGSYRNILNRYLADVAADSGKTTNVFSTLFEYFGSNGSINYRLARTAPITDTRAYPVAGCVTNKKAGVYADGSSYTTCLDDDQVQAEINSVVTARGLPRDLGHIYVLFLPKHVESCFFPGNPKKQQCTINFTPSAAYCAYHGQARGNTVYATMPFPVYKSQTQLSCTDETLGGDGTIQSPNGDKDADVEISPTSHEIAEAITDPDVSTGWFDKNQFENGDDCAYVYGKLSGTSGRLANQAVNGHRYLTQEEFSNADFKASGRVDGCLQRIAAKTPAVTALSKTSGPTAGGTTVTITGTGFPGATTVTFGTVAGTRPVLIDANHLAITTPAHAAGTVDVRVRTPAGASSGGTADRFTFS